VTQSDFLGNLLAEAKPGFACGETDPDGVVQIRMNNVTSEGLLSFQALRRVPRGVARLDRFEVQIGDVLFNATNSPELVGKSALYRGYSEPIVYSNHFLRLRPKSNVLHGGYLAHWLHLLWSRGDFSRMCKQWVNQATVASERLLSLTLPLPPLPEQRRIASILDKADELRSKRKRTLEMLDSLTQAIFVEMFGDQATNPNRWIIRQLQEVVKDGTIVTYGIVQAGEEYAGGVPYIRTGDIVDGGIVQHGLRHTDPAIAAKFGRSRVEAGEIVMSIRATVGTTALVPQELDGANLTQGTARIAPGKSTNSKYLLHFLRSAGTQHWISRQIKGATFREITLSRLRELPVAVPPLSLQVEFDRRLDAVERLTATQQASFSRLSSLFDSLQDRAFRYEL
jgi:type I restriction enzyme, S subunit